MTNQQVPEKRNLDPEGRLEVHSIFHTIQGEGPFAGQRAVFIRLAGCNLQCPLCDTDYTSYRYTHTKESLMDYVREMAPPGELVVITGGEPFRQNLKPVVETLLANGYRIQIETNGTLYQELPFTDITIVCSPKTGSINPQLKNHVHALKYVIHADHYRQFDGLPTQALDHEAHPQLARPWNTFFGRIYLQPVDVRDEIENRRHLAVAVKNVMRYGYTLQLQIHKLIGVE